MKTIVEKVINYCQLHPDHAQLVPNELDASLQVSNMKIWPQKMPFRNDCPGQVPWPIFWMIDNWWFPRQPTCCSASWRCTASMRRWWETSNTFKYYVDNVDYETSATCFYNNVDYDDIIYHIDNVNACSQNYNDHRNIKGNTLQRRQRQPSF